MVDTIDGAWRDFDVQGDPGSNPYKPKKGPQRTVLKRIEASAGIGAVAVATKAELDAITDKADNAPGFVVGDSTAANNGQYSWDDSGSAWVKIRALPDTLAVLENIGGTANAITADTATGVDPTVVQAIVLTAPPGTNTGAVTITLNGGSAEDVKAASGTDPAPGDIVEDVATIFFKVGSEWRQIFTSNPNATFDHQGDYDNGTTYTLDQVVTGSDDNWHQLKVASATGDDPVSSGSGDWLKILDGIAVPDNSITIAKLTAAARAKTVGFKAPALLFADTELDYTVMSAGDRIPAGVFWYEVAPSGASDHHGTNSHATTPLKLYVQLCDDGKHNVLAFGAVGDNSTDDATACQEAADTGEDVLFPEGYTFLVSAEIDATAHGQKFIVEGTIRTTSAINALIRSTDYDDVLVEGKGKLDGGGTATNCAHFIADTRNTYRNRARGVTCTGTATDATLQRAGILFDTTGGKAGTFRHKDVSAVDVVIDDVETHGILTAYCDGVRILGNRINDCRNHGHESVNCTDIIQTLNQVSDCLISGLGVGDNCLNWTISNNTIRNCAGDGAITCEHNSVRGSIHNNQIYDAYGSSCINVSYGTPVAGEFSTIHDISVFGNHCHAKAGYPTIRGVLCYASTSGSEGYAIDISHNTFDNVFLGMDISYLTDSQFCKNIVTSFQGPSGYTAAVLTYVTNSELDGLNVKAATDDHAVKVVAFGASLSDRCTIKGVKVFTTPSSKSIVYIDNGTLFNCYDLETNTSNYGVEVGTGGTSYNAAGIIGNFVSGATTGGTKLTWQA